MSNNVLINDNFISKRADFNTLVDACKGFTHTLDNQQDFLSFELDDIQRLELIPGGFYTFGNYTWNPENPDPMLEENGKWSRYGSPYTNCNIGTPDEQTAPLLNEEGVWINDTSTGVIAYYYKQLTNEQQEQIKSTGIGESTFTVALPPMKIHRPSPYNFTPINVINRNFFKNRPNQHSFISFGAYDNNKPNLQFRFVVNFRNIYNSATDTWMVYIGNSVSEPLVNCAPVEGWDGLSFKKFKFEYAPSADDGIIGRLYILDETTGDWNIIRENFIASTDAATYKNAPEWGCYSTPGVGTIVVRDFNFKAFIRSEYTYTLNGVIFQSSVDLVNYCFDNYSYNIGGTGNVNIDWFFNNRQNQIDLSSGKITFDKEWFPADETFNFDYFQKKNKTLKISGDKGSITSFENPGKKIARINLKSCSNLQILDLSDNPIQELDLSANSNLTSINVSNCSQLTRLILPKGTDSKLEYLNISNTKISRIDLSDLNTSKVDLELVFDQLTLTSLDITGIKLKNPDTFGEGVINVQNDLQYINISETNLLTNKANLEKFLNLLPNRFGKEVGIIYMYGKKYTSGGIQGSSKAIAKTLDTLKTYNWLFYL